MWPFTPKTLYERYSKLMKLIMSIDSHFEVTENKEESGNTLEYSYNMSSINRCKNNYELYGKV